MRKSQIHFTKMHGAGNDYIYVNTMLYDIPNPAEAAIKWSAYHTGVGSDGLILIGKPSIMSGADFSMRIFNADGSEAMMCGNGARCVGKYLYDKKLTDKTEIKLETLSGVKTLRLHTDGGVIESVTVDMLEPALHCAEQFDEGIGLSEMESLGSPMFVSMGNPHCVILVKTVDGLDITGLGKKFEHSKAFPQRCNIEFAQLLDDGKVRVRVWERGSGITMACGTGACATAVALASMGVTPRKSQIIMDGGELSIEWSSQDNHIYMTGPAAFAFEGEITL